MRRVHLFEFEDQSWFPAPIRDLVTDFLQRGVILRLRVYDPVVPLLKRVMDSLGSHRIVDLCSGACGPWPQLYQQLGGGPQAVSVTLTDKYPSATARERLAALSDAGVEYLAQPVDATDVPASLSGIRTLFTSFHHFRPEVARRILRNAVEHRAGIGIFEFTERRWKTVLMTPLVAPLIILLTTPFTPPVTFVRLFWTYVIPLVPLVAAWDGVVSNLRTYRPDELRALIAAVASEGYSWEVGQLAAPEARAPITYVLGYPHGGDSAPGAAGQW
jgi:hypothetical protein